MPVGIETYVKGSADVQLTTDAVYFSLEQQGIVSGGWVQNGGYYLVDKVLAFSGQGHPALVIHPKTYPNSVSYSILSVQGTSIRVRFITNNPNVVIKYFIFSTKPPSPNLSRKGLELYKKNVCVYASETRVLRPLIKDAEPFVMPPEKTLGILVNKQGYDWYRSWSQEDTTEYWFLEQLSIYGTYFKSQNYCASTSFTNQQEWISSSGPSPFGEISRNNDVEHVEYIDLTNY